MTRALYAIATVAIAACLIDRRSSDFTCATQDDCADGRTCDDGFCVAPACPEPCDTCDLVAGTCTITCDSPGACGAVSCPDGLECDIACTAFDACGVIRCNDAAACRITCSELGACGAINCGDGAECDIACSTGECGTINCRDACRCDVECGGACPLASCPEAADGSDCEDLLGACDSSIDASCDRC